MEGRDLIEWVAAGHTLDVRVLVGDGSKAHELNGQPLVPIDTVTVGSLIELGAGCYLHEPGTAIAHLCKSQILI